MIGYETPLGEQRRPTIDKAIPSAEAVRFVASGSEAVATAMRLARAHTGRDVIIKIDGHFNGGSDYAMYNSLVAYTDAENSGGRPSRPIPSSGGIPRAVANTVVPIPWNDLPALEAALDPVSRPGGGLIMVPIDFNNGCITPTAGYLAAAGTWRTRMGPSSCSTKCSRVQDGIGGAQTLYGVTPDVTMLSKAMSSGVPLSAVVGRREYMDTLAKPVPAGAIQGGTFAGNVLGLAAADATLDIISACPTSTPPSWGGPTASTPTSRPSSIGRRSPHACSP